MFVSSSKFQRKSPGKNNHNASKLVEKYNDLAREALSNGDKILSENYLQHADHFTRVINEKESLKREKFSENRSENSTAVIEENIENSDQVQDKDLVNTSSEENQIEKSVKPLAEIN